MKIPFDIKYRPQIESGEYKVETRNGLPVRIICWDRKYGYPIVGLAYEKATGCESYVSAYEDGTTSTNGKMELSDDLFIVTPEEELTKFEKVVKGRLWRTLEYSETFRKDENKWTRELAAEFLALAEKEIAKGHEHDVYIPEDTYYEQLKKQWEDGYDKGKTETLKDLPRWKKIKEEDNTCVREPHVGTNMVGEKMLYIGNRAISISRLEKLPGFKED